MLLLLSLSLKSNLLVDGIMCFSRTLHISDRRLEIRILYLALFDRPDHLEKVTSFRFKSLSSKPARCCSNTGSRGLKSKENFS